MPKTDPTTAPSDPRMKAILATVKDYFEGWFDGDPDRIGRSLHAALNKRGVSVDERGVHLSASMTAGQMVGWTRDGEGKAERPTNLAIRISVDHIHEAIATATVHGGPYVEYLQLMLTEDGWRIVNALYMHRSVDA